jgi:predicted MFS family arabinose efflux permease
MWSSAMTPMLLVSSLAQAVVGTACIRFGVRAVLLASLACLLASFVVLSGTLELWHLYLAMGLLAAGNAGIGDVVVGAVITRWFDRARGIALGIALTGSNLGGVVFVHAIVTVSATGSWRQAALAVGIGGVAVMLPFAIFAVRNPRPGELEVAGAIPAAQDGIAAIADAPSLDLGTAVRTPAFWILVYVLFCYAFSQLGMVDHLMLYWTDLGHSRAEAAGYLELTLGAGIVSKLGAGALALRLSARTALALNTLVLTGSILLLPFADRAGVLPVFALMFGVATAARDVLFPLLIAQLFGTRYLAQLYGFIMLAFFPGGGIGPLMLAWVRDQLGGYELGFAACAALDLAALIALLFVRRPRAR